MPATRSRSARRSGGGSRPHRAPPLAPSLAPLAARAAYHGVRAARHRDGRRLHRGRAARAVDRLVAEIGTPPDVAKAEALVARLPLSVRIVGPAVNWDSHPGRSGHRGWMDDRPGNLGGRGDWLTRTTADGHRVTFGIGTLPWQ